MFGLDGPDGVGGGCRGDENELTGGNEDRGQAAFGVTYFIGPPARCLENYMAIELIVDEATKFMWRPDINNRLATCRPFFQDSNNEK